MHNHWDDRQCNALLPPRRHALVKKGSLFSGQLKEEQPSKEARDVQEQFYKYLHRKIYGEDPHDSRQKQLLKAMTRSTWCLRNLTGVEEFKRQTRLRFRFSLRRIAQTYRMTAHQSHRDNHEQKRAAPPPRRRPQQRSLRDSGFPSFLSSFSASFF